MDLVKFFPDAGNLLLQFRGLQRFRLSLEEHDP